MRLKTMILLSFMVLFIGYSIHSGIIAYKNTQGVCIEEGRKLTDRELIERLVTIINQDRYVQYLPNSFEGPSPKAIPYDTAEDFLKQNPECCEVKDVKTYMQWDSLLDLWGGYHRARVIFYYKVRFYDQNHQLTSIPIEEDQLVSNCGEFYDR